MGVKGGGIAATFFKRSVNTITLRGVMQCTVTPLKEDFSMR
jgi:hypothetical protein